MTIKLEQTDFTDVTLPTDEIQLKATKANSIRPKAERKSNWEGDEENHAPTTEIIDLNREVRQFLINGRITGASALTTTRNLETMCKAPGNKTFTWDSFLQSTATVTVTSYTIKEVGGEKNRFNYTLALTKVDERS